MRCRLFEPFFTIKSDAGGLGVPVGLRRVRPHGGFVTFETEVGQGTDFPCHFPALSSV